MTVVLAIVAGVLFASAVYLMLRRSVLKLALGLSLLANAANLVIFVSAGLTRGEPPLVADGETMPPPGAPVRASVRAGGGRGGGELSLRDANL